MSARQPLLKRLLLVAKFSRRHTGNMMRRRLVVEGLEDRKLMAYDLSVGPIVAEHSAAIELTSDSATSSGTEIGQLLFSTQPSQVLSNFEQSEAFDRVLYTVGSKFGQLAYIRTDLLSGNSEFKVLSALLSGSNNGIIFDVERVNGEIVFVSQSQVNAQGSNAATKHDIFGTPVAVMLPQGAQSISGEAQAITPTGIIGGRSLSFDSFVTTGRGSFVLPKNFNTELSGVRSISDSGVFIGGSADGQMIAWESTGDPEDGDYQLLNLAWALPLDSQGAFTMNFVVDSSTYGGLGFGSFLDVDGEKHEALWSLSDGALLKDFGAGSTVLDAKVIDGTTFVAYNDSTGAHVLNFESGKVYDLSTLLDTTQSITLTSGAIFETDDNGEKALGFSYTIGGELKASVFALTKPTVDVSWDFDGNGTIDLSQNDFTLPSTIEHTFSALGPTTIKAKITDSSGSVFDVEKTVTVQNTALVAVDGKQTLLIGGDAANDVVSLEKLESGALKVTVNGTTQEFAVVDEIFADLGDGENRLAASGALVLNSDHLAQLSFVTLADGATLSNFTEAAAVQMGATSSGPVLTLTTPPKTGASPIAFSNEWIYTELQTVSGIPQHRIVGATGLQILIKNGHYQNPLNNIDTNGNGRITPTDALLIINYLNERSGGNTPPILWNINVNGDTRISPSDALAVINYLNSRPSGEGESPNSSFDSASTTSLISDPAWMFDWLDSDDQLRRNRKR